MNRAERRRQSRTHAQKIPTMILGDGIVAAELPGHAFEAKPKAELPEKVKGKHRWLAIASYVMSDEDFAGAFNEDKIKLMNAEKMFDLSAGCYDCEMTLQEAAKVPCPGNREYMEVGFSDEVKR